METNGSVEKKELTDGMDDSTRSHSRVSQQVYWKAVTGFFRILAVGPYRSFGKYTLFIFICGGLAGVLLDLDHLIIIQTQMVRPLHLPIWIGLCACGIGYYAYLHRRVHQLGVTEKKG